MIPRHQPEENRRNYHTGGDTSQNIIGDNTCSTGERLGFADRPGLGDIKQPEQDKCQPVADQLPLSRLKEEQQQGQPLADDFIDHHRAGILIPVLR